MLVIKGKIIKRTQRMINLGGQQSAVAAMDTNQQLQQLISQLQNGSSQSQQPQPQQPQSDKSFRKVTYQVIGDDGLLYQVTDVEPKEPLPKNEAIEIPIQVKVFVTRKGAPGYELAVAGGDDGMSEEF